MKVNVTVRLAKVLLIEPFGIETDSYVVDEYNAVDLLIEPFGIETAAACC